MREEERRLILDMVASGKISVEESLRLMEALEDPEPEEPEAEPGRTQPPAAEAVSPAPALEAARAYTPEEAPVSAAPENFAAASQEVGPEEALPLEGEVTGSAAAEQPGPETWRRFRQVPLLIGTGIVTAGALLMGAALLATGAGFWFFCASVPFLLGLVILVLAQGGQGLPWLHLRVQQPEGTWPSTIAFSFPLPIRLVTWILRTFGIKIDLPGDLSVDELLLLLEQGVSPDSPVYIEAGEDGQRVQVYIG